MGGYSSGQRGLTVNQLAYAYVGSNPTPPTIKIYFKLASCQRFCAKANLCLTGAPASGRESYSTHH